MWKCFKLTSNYLEWSRKELKEKIKNIPFPGKLDFPPPPPSHPSNKAIAGGFSGMNKCISFNTFVV